MILTSGQIVLGHGIILCSSMEVRLTMWKMKSSHQDQVFSIRLEVLVFSKTPFVIYTTPFDLPDIGPALPDKEQWDLATRTGFEGSYTEFILITLGVTLGVTHSLSLPGALIFYVTISEMSVAGRFPAEDVIESGCFVVRAESVPAR